MVRYPENSHSCLSSLDLDYYHSLNMGCPWKPPQASACQNDIGQWLVMSGMLHFIMEAAVIIKCFQMRYKWQLWQLRASGIASQQFLLILSESLGRICLESLPPSKRGPSSRHFPLQLLTSWQREETSLIMVFQKQVKTQLFLIFKD